MNPSAENYLQDADRDAVLTAFTQERTLTGGAAALSEWMERYPDQARDLARLAAQTWAGEDHEPAAPETEARFRSIGLAALRACRPEPKRAEVITFSTAPMTSLLAAAKAAGGNADTVASALDLPIALFWKLHRRLIAPDSLPLALTTLLADAVHRTLDEVTAYLRMPPQIAAGASFRSDDAPKVGEPESFESALQAEPEVTDAQRARWLSGGGE
ncbi:MAG: hypothetical protein H7Z41_07590 [Cytophagales bacterium]|nr:hypothetical protein [Armatimonadota bacterium]